MCLPCQILANRRLCTESQVRGSFEELGLDANATARLQALYNDNIDALEWPVAILIEQSTDDLPLFFGEVGAFSALP